MKKYSINFKMKKSSYQKWALYHNGKKIGIFSVEEIEGICWVLSLNKIEKMKFMAYGRKF